MAPLMSNGGFEGRVDHWKNAVHFSQNLELEMIQRDTKKALTKVFVFSKGREDLSWHLEIFWRPKSPFHHGGIVIAVFSLLEESEVFHLASASALNADFPVSKAYLWNVLPGGASQGEKETEG